MNITVFEIDFNNFLIMSENREKFSANTLQHTQDVLCTKFSTDVATCISKKEKTLNNRTVLYERLFFPISRRGRRSAGRSLPSSSEDTLECWNAKWAPPTSQISSSLPQPEARAERERRATLSVHAIFFSLSLFSSLTSRAGKSQNVSKSYLFASSTSQHPPTQFQPTIF